MCSNRCFPAWLICGVVSALLFVIGSFWPTLFGQTVSSVEHGEWRDYAGDTYGLKYSPLDQINVSNVQDLQVAWRWASEVAPENRTGR